jgi:hypothetical protein
VYNYNIPTNEGQKMKKIAFILSLLVFSGGFTSAQANSEGYEFVTPILTTTFELPAQSDSSRWREVEYPYTVNLKTDGTAAMFSFALIDGEGFKLQEQRNINPNNFTSQYKDPVSWSASNKFRLHRYDKAKLPITLRVTVEFWNTTGKPEIVRTFPLNFVTHKDDIAASAKAEADAKAKLVNDAKIIADAKAASDAAALWNKAVAELKAKQEEEQLRLALDAAIKKAIVGKPCNKAGQKQVYAGAKFTCVKSGKKLIWKRTY